MHAKHSYYHVSESLLSFQEIDQQYSIVLRQTCTGCSMDIRANIQDSKIHSLYSMLVQYCSPTDLYRLFLGHSR